MFSERIGKIKQSRCLFVEVSMVAVSKQRTFIDEELRYVLQPVLDWCGMVKALTGQTRVAAGSGKLCHYF